MDRSGFLYRLFIYYVKLTIPTIYYVTRDGEGFRADTRSNTILHRVKLGFGPIGFYETTLSRTGRPDYTELFEVTPANQVLANNAGVFDDNILRTVPIYDRNINASLTVKSTHPSPANILTWEGVYNNISINVGRYIQSMVTVCIRYENR